MKKMMVLSGVALLAACVVFASQTGILPDGGRFDAPLVDGKLQGSGAIEWPNGDRYEGDFKDGLMHGQGVYHYRDERFEGTFANGTMSGQGKHYVDDELVYEGEFKAGKYHGQGVYHGDGYRWEGTFVEDQFTGHGTQTELGDHPTRYEGEFKDWEFQGEGKLSRHNGEYYQGQFEDGSLNGWGVHVDAKGNRYEGGFEYWYYSGTGTYTYANGDRYVGHFANGKFSGKGAYFYAEPKDGVALLEGEWRAGKRIKDANGNRLDRTLPALERALYTEQSRLDALLNRVDAGKAGQLDTFFVGVAGDGTQKVFAREVDFVNRKLKERYAIEGKTALLINDRDQIAQQVMATNHSIREVLKGVAAKMNTDEDLLILYLTSHGSRDHELSFKQAGIRLSDLPSDELDRYLDEAGIKWRFIIVSACYSGGFIDALKDDFSLIITAASATKSSFGCSDEADLTYFARALFQESFDEKSTWPSMFDKARDKVSEWEKDEKLTPSEPQIYVGSQIEAKLAALERN